jgi:ribosomal protein S18 acetylase RimI-like enzyme
MSDPVLVRAIEERMLNAWPALETRIAGDWLLRFADGYSKRANSATTLTAGAAMDAAMIGHLVEQARLWGIPAVVRVTPLCAGHLETALAGGGFAPVEPTFAMTAPTDEAAMDTRVAISEAPTPDWIAANAASYGGVKADAGKLAAILARVRPPAAYATLSEDGEALAWGIGAVERGMIGLQDIVVAPAARGRRLARALVGALIAWGRTQGADRAYLHVAGHNAPARALYRSLGFTEAYAISHRVRAG